MIKVIGINNTNINIIKSGTKCFKCKYARAYKQKKNPCKYICIICSKLNREIINNYGYCKYKVVEKYNINIGDLVKTRDDLVQYIKYKGVTYLDSMKIVSGKVDNIEELYNKKLYKVGKYYYTDEMIEKI